VVFDVSTRRRAPPERFWFALISQA